MHPKTLCNILKSSLSPTVMVHSVTVQISLLYTPSTSQVEV